MVTFTPTQIFHVTRQQHSIILRCFHCCWDTSEIRISRKAQYCKKETSSLRPKCWT